MNKKIIIIVILLSFLVILGLYYTFAIDVSMDKTTGDVDLTFNIDIKDTSGRTVSVPAGKTKIFDLILTNSNNANINYAIAYSGTKPSNVIIAQLYTSKDSVSGIINKNSTKQISLIIINKSTTDYTYTIAPVTGYEKGGELIVPNNNTLITDIYSIPNKPALVDGLIPVRYDDVNQVWVKADKDNTNFDWYDYDEKKWANAVLVTSTNRNTYMNSNVGTTIPESDVLAYYVWIPRYKYKVWNINKEAGVDSYDAYHKGIDIVFEQGKQSTGTISCNYDFSVIPDDTHKSEICIGSNGDYYTHPGFWVGKFETDLSHSSVAIKPNLYYAADGIFTNWWYDISNMQSNNNIYGLNTSKSNTDSHVMKSLERGAVLYFTNSKYGRCSNNVCTGLGANGYRVVYDFDENEFRFMTGCGSLASGETSSVCNAYNTSLGKQASTTGNIYGIYDMKGGASEYVMGNMSSVVGSYNYSDSYGGGANSYTYTGNEKYLDPYSVSNDYTFSKYASKLGDAVGELYIVDGDYNADLWYNGWCEVSSNGPWLETDGYDIWPYPGYAESEATTRATLVSLH